MITRTPLRADVHRELLGLILHGTLEPGEHLREAELGDKLGVSRTPIREALLRLEREGFIHSQMGQGFFVRSLSEQEVREVYPLIGLLESAAIRSLPKLSKVKADKLEGISQSILQAADDPEARIELDAAWHRALLDDCTNGQLFRMLDDLKRILFRYECAFMQVSQWVHESAREHRSIIKAFQKGDTLHAATLLEAHWDRSMHSVLTQL